MNDDALSRLPEKLARSIRQASVPADVRALFSHLPSELVVDATLSPEPKALPLAARQLLKLVTVSDKTALGVLRVGERGAPVVVRVRGKKAEVCLDDWSAAGDVSRIATRIVRAIFGPDDLVAIIDSFARRTAKLTALEMLTHRMLASRDLDEALYVLLLAITSGQGLAFNRAAFFLYDESRKAFVGSKAIGPHDESQAHRIWEEIEYADKNVDDFLTDYSAQNLDTRFQYFVQTLDLIPGSGDGDEVAAALREHHPIVFHTEQTKNETLRPLAERGPFVMAVLRPRGAIRGLVFADNLFSHADVSEEDRTSFGFFLDHMSLIWERLALLQSVEELARVDALTGVFNRREFEARLVEEQSRAVRLAHPCSMLLLDLDRFKEVNDTEGHEAGDRVLKKVGGLLKQGLRSHDVVARYGGDEFVVLLPEASRDTLLRVATRIGSQAKKLGISVSIGGATWPDDCTDPSRLFTSSDEALYQAKRGGRGRACFAGHVVVEYT